MWITTGLRKERRSKRGTKGVSDVVGCIGGRITLHEAKEKHVRT